MKAFLSPASRLAGALEVIPSKSSLHRALFCAALAKGKSSVGPLVQSRDVLATLDALRFLGAQTQPESGSRLEIHSEGLCPRGGDIDVHESGSTLRFVIPLLLCSDLPCRVIGREGLARRPLGPYRELFSRPGLEYREGSTGCLPLDLRGPLKSGDFILRGDVSSQFITGLLLALPLLKGSSRILLSTELESADYVAMTLETLAQAGIVVKPIQAGEVTGYGGYLVPGSQSYRAGRYDAEGDWSAAAFWVVANTLGSRVSLSGLRSDSLQPDSQVTRICAESPQEIDLSACPDLLPILSVWAGLCGHPVRLRGCARVRIKECDRVMAMARELNAIGGRIRELPDGLDIEPVSAYEGGLVNGWNDHRVVMALAIASLASRSEIVIEGAQAVDKSYPGFFDDFKKLGGSCHVE